MSECACAGYECMIKYTSSLTGEEGDLSHIQITLIAAIHVPFLIELAV